MSRDQSQSLIWRRLDPLDLGIKRCEIKDLAGGDAQLNASILEDVFGGAQNAVADALNLNAGVALAACEVAGSPQEGVAMAQVSDFCGVTFCFLSQAAISTMTYLV